MRSLNLSDLRVEPFRLFFPAAVLTGLLGVAVWPLHFGGFLELYPGSSHTRLMGQGFFGGFIFGFLGTALPRMLSAQPFRIWQLGASLALFIVFAGANLAGKTFAGDAAFLVLLILFASAALARVLTRQDVPPPGFTLVGLAFLCGISGTTIGLLDHLTEIDPRWMMLRPLLAYQGFVLLPILGVGAFILPRFLGLPNTHNFPESIRPPKGWWAKALFSLSIGLIIIFSFFLEVSGWHRLSHAIRFGAVLAALGASVPAHKAGFRDHAVGWALRLGLLMILTGLLAVVIWPEFRVALLHILLVGGLGLVTLIVATRVLFGHSGNRSALGAPNRWLWWSLGFILLGMATRVSGDFLPNIMISHYNYGALLWAIGISIWAWKVLPMARIPEEESSS